MVVNPSRGWPAGNRLGQRLDETVRVRVTRAGRCSPLRIAPIASRGTRRRSRWLRPDPISLPGQTDAEGQHVGVVPSAGADRRLGIGAQRGADAGDLVGRHRHARAGPAPHDAAVGSALGDCRSDVLTDLGPDLAVGDIDHLVPGCGEVTLDGFGHGRDLVGADGDAHVSSARPASTPAARPTSARGCPRRGCSMTRPSMASTRTSPRRTGGSSTE